MMKHDSAVFDPFEFRMATDEVACDAILREMAGRLERTVCVLDRSRQLIEDSRRILSEIKNAR